MEWNMEENFSMEWNMEENFSMEWKKEWKIFGMEWKWNSRKLPVWNMEKSSSIPYHALAVATGGRGCRAPHFGLLKILFLEHYTTTRPQTMMEKLLYINLTQYSVLLTRLYGCVAEETSKPAESLPVLR